MSTAKRSSDPQPLWRRRIADAVATHGQLVKIAGAAKMSSSQLQKIVNGTTKDPGISTIERIAVAMGTTLVALVNPRPESGAGREGRSEQSATDRLEEPLAAHLRRAAQQLDTEFPAEDSVQGDIYKAVAALNRALRRPTAPAEPSPKTGKA